MTAPAGTELLGANAREVEIAGAGARTTVPLDADGQRKLAACLAAASEGKPRGRVYLSLENIRGAHDASVLNVYINLPVGARPGEHRHLLAGSVGLYGLRRASIPQGEEGGMGLSYMLDITSVLLELANARLLGADEFTVSMLPQRQLAESDHLLVKRVAMVL